MFLLLEVYKQVNVLISLYILLIIIIITREMAIMGKQACNRNRWIRWK